MKRIFILVFIVLLLLLPLLGCEDEESTEKKRGGSADVLIISEGDGMADQTAEYIGASLHEQGYSSEIAPKGAKADGYSLIIAVGTEAPRAAVSVVSLSFESGDAGENMIAPAVSSKSLARAAVLLLPEAKKYSVISEESGAADVQDACDFLDSSGVDYTVEALDGKAYGDAVMAAAEKGCDAMILPSGDHSGGVDLSQYETAVIAIGEGEPIRGALASFCIDTEALARGAARLAVGLLSGEDAAFEPESYYALCISESAASRFAVDIEAVREDFRVVIVE